MKKKRTAAVALGVAIPFAAVMLFDPKEAVDNPHTHQEAPNVPIFESGAAIISTLSGTPVSVSYSADAYLTSANATQFI